ncbi:MAG: FixG Ig-like domain-containing protein [Parasphingorhabdus sp.]|nr:FixG Ig-like domain-containing protein [Parasphingorhabdus sp.]
MEQIGRPRGLIDYLTLDDEKVEKAGGIANPVLKTLFRPRTLVYFGIWCAIGLAMLFTLGQRTRLDLAVQHDRNPVFVQLSDGTIRNNFTVKVRNMETRPREVELVVKGLPSAVVWTSTGSRETASQRVKLSVAPDAVQKVRLFVAAPAAGPARTDFEIEAIALSGNERGDSDSVRFERPETGQ